MSSNTLEQPITRICQSCGMPLRQSSDSGTDEQGGPASDYCGFCYRNGRFTEPALSEPEMMDRCVDWLVHRNGMDEREAQLLMSRTLPGLKRWKDARTS